MPAYDPLITHLQKNIWIDQRTAITLLNDYNSLQNRYRALRDLVQRNILERKHEDGMTFYRLRVIARPMPQRKDDEKVFMLWVRLYCYFVRYGAEHFSAPGRVKFMSIMKLWIERYRRQIQFAALLIDLLDNEPSRQVYMELDEGLKKEGWYEHDTDPVDMIDTVIHWLNDERVTNYLGVSDETWQSLHDYDGLGRVNNAVEQESKFDPTWPYFQEDFETDEEYQERAARLKEANNIRRNGAGN